MAGDWVKMRDELDEDPHVLRMAELLQCDVDLVIGRLRRFWAWAGRHTTTGVLRGVTLAMIDCAVRHAGFAKALTDVDWLKSSESGELSVPRWNKHNAKSAKKRVLDALRASRYRSRKERDASVTNHATRGEERRGNKKKEKKKELGDCEIDTNQTGGNPSEVDSGGDFLVSGEPGIWSIPDSLLGKLRGGYPELDVDGAIRRARLWCETNPDRRKSPDEMPQFLNGFLANEQRNGGPKNVGQKSQTSGASASPARPRKGKYKYRPPSKAKP